MEKEPNQIIETALDILAGIATILVMPIVLLWIITYEGYKKLIKVP